MVTKAEAADVLERAADLYESEQIDWCHGSWGTQVFNDKPGTFHCAEGAILRAAGYSMKNILDAQANKVPGTNVLAGMLLSPLVQEAMRAVTEVAGSPVYNDRASLHSFNDRLPRDKAKGYLIEKFKEAAKDLRNDS